MGGSGRAAALCFAQGETQVIVMLRQQLARVPGIQPAEQHQDRGAAVLMAAGQCRFASLRVQSVAAMTIAICRSAQCELSACVHPQIAVHPTVTDGEPGRQHVDDLPLGPVEPSDWLSLPPLPARSVGQ